MNLKRARIMFKLSRFSDDGEDFQDVFADGENIGKLTWWTGATSGWYFEGHDGQPRYICPLEAEGFNKYGDPVLLSLDDVKERATEWLRQRGKV